MKQHKTKLGLFVTQKITIGDTTINCIVDTGSPMTIIDKTVVKPTGKTEFVNLHGVTGFKAQVLKTKFDIEFDTQVSIGDGTILSRKHTVLLMDLKSVNENWGKRHNIRGLIGMDLIAKTTWLNFDK
jgi:hypothetical protein